MENVIQKRKELLKRLSKNPDYIEFCTILKEYHKTKISRASMVVGFTRNDVFFTERDLNGAVVKVINQVTNLGDDEVSDTLAKGKGPYGK